MSVCVEKQQSQFPKPNTNPPGIVSSPLPPALVENSGLNDTKALVKRLVEPLLSPRTTTVMLASGSRDVNKGFSAKMRGSWVTD